LRWGRIDREVALAALVGTLVFELAFVAAFRSVGSTGRIEGGRRFHDGVTYLFVRVASLRKGV
jgi:hypothetical protein